jgi:thiol-disulfide isomerase/thioredoxin
MIVALALIARLVLAGVFAVAGIAKLADRQGTRKAAIGFGAPERIAGVLAIALPLAELAVAGLLLPASTAVYGALGAVALLALFTGAIAISLARGRAPDCHCFGQLHSAPASWRTLARNAVLLGIGVVALAGSVAEEPKSAVAWIGELSDSELALLAVGATAAVVIAVGGAAFLSLMRSYGKVLTRLERVEAALSNAGLDLEEALDADQIGLEPGTAAPTFWAKSLTGESVSRDSLTESGVPSVVLFTSPHCGPCQALLPLVAAWQREHAGALNVVIASDGTNEEIEAEARELALENVLVDADRRLYAAFQANGTPSAVIVAPDGTIGSWVASGREWIEQLVASALGGTEGEGLPIGTEAPALELPSLDGGPVSLEALQGRESVLLFWNPDCGFCRSMHEDLLAWEGSVNGAGPRLVVVSSGAEESTRAEGFRSLVLLDAEYAAGTAFQAHGTPMAVLIDAEGRVASAVAAGADAAFDLMGARRSAPTH